MAKAKKAARKVVKKKGRVADVQCVVWMDGDVVDWLDGLAKALGVKRSVAVRMVLRGVVRDRKARELFRAQLQALLMEVV